MIQLLFRFVLNCKKELVCVCEELVITDIDEDYSQNGEYDDIDDDILEYLNPLVSSMSLIITV